MKITKNTLKKLIKEELAQVLYEDNMDMDTFRKQAYEAGVKIPKPLEKYQSPPELQRMDKPVWASIDTLRLRGLGAKEILEALEFHVVQLFSEYVAPGRERAGHDGLKFVDRTGEEDPLRKVRAHLKSQGQEMPFEPYS